MNMRPTFLKESQNPADLLLICFSAFLTFMSSFLVILLMSVVLFNPLCLYLHVSVCVPVQHFHSVCKLQLFVLCEPVQLLVVILQMFQSELQSCFLLTEPPQR